MFGLTEAATSRRANRRLSVDPYENRWIIFPTEVFTLYGWHGLYMDVSRWQGPI